MRLRYQLRQRVGARTAAITATALALGGTVAILVAIHAQQTAPRPSEQAQTAPLGPTSSAAPSTIASSASPTLSSARPVRPRSTPPTSISPPGPRTSLAPGNGTLALARSTPVSIDIPAIGVSSKLLQLGLNNDGTVQVPPLSADSRAGWYRYSPTPGSRGSAVMLGHIDSAAYGPGVFFRLGALRPGDEVDVRLADARTAVFRVDRVAEYPKSGFPAQSVYGQTTYPSLRLITCGGAFDSSTGNYLDNVVAFASLVSSRA